MPSYRNRGPPDLPIAVIVKFDHYNRPTLHDGTVPIIPIRHTWFNSGVQCSHLQLPHKLAWAVRHHPQVPGPHPWQSSNRFWEFSCGRIFVACSRVRHLTDILFTPPFTFQHLANLFNSQHLHERQLEDKMLVAMQPSSAFSESTLHLHSQCFWTLLLHLHRSDRPWRFSIPPSHTIDCLSPMQMYVVN